MQISRGQILIRANASLPQQFSMKGDRLQGGGWIALNENAHEIERKVRNADWHFFWITDQVEASAFGRRADEVLRSALRRALRRISGRYNAAEVLEVRHQRLFGLHFVRVRVASRHIQREAILGLSESVGLLSPALIPPEETEFDERETHALAA